MPGAPCSLNQPKITLALLHLPQRMGVNSAVAPASLRIRECWLNAPAWRGSCVAGKAAVENASSWDCAGTHGEIGERPAKRWA